MDGSNQHRIILAKPVILLDENGTVIQPPQIQILFDNMTGKQICCGTVISTRYAAFIISIIELIALFFFVMNLPEILVKDGYLFYTDAIQGLGVYSFSVCVVISVISALAVVILLIGLRTRNYRSLIPHLIWQALIILICAIQITIIGCLLFWSKILCPAAIVLIFFFTTIILLQLWWFTILLNCCLDFRDRELRGEKGMASPDIEHVPSIVLQSPSVSSVLERHNADDQLSSDFIGQVSEVERWNEEDFCQSSVNKSSANLLLTSATSLSAYPNPSVNNSSSLISYSLSIPFMDSSESEESLSDHVSRRIPATPTCIQSPQPPPGTDNFIKESTENDAL